MNSWIWSYDGWIVLAGVLSACSCALLGNYLVLRRMSLMGDAISHAVLPGLALAFLLSHSRAAWPMFVGAVIVGLITTLLSETVNRYGKVEHGAAMGVVFSILFALGLILIRQAADHVDLDPSCVLYGNITLIPLEAVGGHAPPAVIQLAVVLLINVLFVALFYKELKITTFDPALATTLGIRASVMHYALMIAVAVTTVASFEAVGSILVIAMLIVPAAAAHLMTDRLGTMIAISLILSAAAAVIGHLTAFLGPAWVGFESSVSVNTAAMMAVVAGLFFLLAVFLAPQHGLVSRMIHRARLSLQIVREDILGLLYRWHELRPAAGRALRRDELDDALRAGWHGRWARRSLVRQGFIENVPGSRQETAVELTEKGLHHAAQLIRSHRLWETFLAKHFELPLDHLHGPAERMEHFITPAMDKQLGEQLTSPTRDPHGREIPEKEVQRRDRGER